MHAGLHQRVLGAAVVASLALGCGSRSELALGDPVREAGSDGPGCIPDTCAAVQAVCGTLPDGCGGILYCGACPEQLCGGGGANRCGFYDCAPTTCAGVGAECGIVSDGCSRALDCGRCRADEACSSGVCVRVHGGGGESAQP